jgi:hypothetical protein
MRRLGDLLWELRTEVTSRLRTALYRIQGEALLVDAAPATVLFNLTIFAVVHRVADRLPCDVTLSADNILDYGDEWQQDRKLRRVRGDATYACRLFCKRLERFGGRTELLVGGFAHGRVMRVKVEVVRQPDCVRLCLSESDKPVSAQELPLPDRLLPPRGKL